MMTGNGFQTADSSTTVLVDLGIIYPMTYIQFTHPRHR